MQPELTQAFITSITGSPDTVMEWRVISDTDKSDKGRNIRGTLSEKYNELCQWNNAGYAIFVCISQCDGKGKKLQNVSAIRAHFVDLDNTLSSNACYNNAINSSMPPHFAVQSSPNKYHLYWLTEPYSGNEFFSLHQKKLIQLYDGDETIIDATRVMRVPGFNHYKGDPVPVTCWQTSSAPRYTSEQIQNSLAYVNVIERMTARSPLGTENMKSPGLEWAKFALYLTNPNDLDYGSWLTMTAAFKQSAWLYGEEEILFNIWQEWCQQYQGSDTGENTKLWESIKDTEVGWAHFRRVTTIDAYIKNTGKASEPQQAVKTFDSPTKEKEDDNFGEILETHEKQKWFKDCYFVEQFGKIYTSTGRFMNVTQFNGAYGGKQFKMSGLGSSISKKPWEASLNATDWTIPKVDHIRFLPEEEQFSITKDALGRKGLNTYIKPNIEMHEGDVSLWLNHLDKMFPDKNDLHIFCSYLAHCVKYPGSKIPWAVLYQSAEGIGKTMFEDVLKHGLGEMYTYTPNAQELAASGSKFNAWMRSKLGIIVNEIRIAERRDLIEVLKPMITDLRIEVQGKGADQEMEDNCANWLFFSNWKDAIPISRNGRRYCVFFSPYQTEQDIFDDGMDTAYFNRLRNWYKKEGGIQAITWWLHQYPIEREGLPGRAPKTSSHQEALRISRTPIEALLDDCIENKEYGYKNGYVSYNMFLKTVENSRHRTPPEHVIKQAIVSKGYRELGYYSRVIANEDMTKPPLIYGKGVNAPLEAYEQSQM